MKIHNPDIQAKVLGNEERAYMGNSLSMYYVLRGYGVETVEGWLMIQLEDLNCFCGVDKKMNELQLINLSKLIISGFGYLKFSEMLLFFAKLKTGQYGQFYGVVDPMKVTSALSEFVTERTQKVRFYNEKALKEQQEKERIEKERIVMTRQEYDEISWLFKM